MEDDDGEIGDTGVPVPPPDFLELVLRMMGGENLLPILRARVNAAKSGKATKVSPCVQAKLSAVEQEMGKLTREIIILRQAKQRITSLLEGLDNEAKLFQTKQGEIDEILKILTIESESIHTETLNRLEGVRDEAEMDPQEAEKVT